MESDALSQFPPHVLEEKRREARRHLTQTRPEPNRAPLAPSEKKEGEEPGQREAPEDLMRKREEAKVALSEGRHIPPKTLEENYIRDEKTHLLAKEALTRSKLYADYLRAHQRASRSQRETTPIPKKIELAPKREAHEAPRSAPKRIPREPAPAVKTLRGDIARAVRSNEVSLAEIAVEEQRRRRASEQESFVRKTRRWQFQVIAASITLLALGTALVTYFIVQRKSVPDTLPKPLEDARSLILPDRYFPAEIGELTHMALGQLIATVISQNSLSPGMTHILLTKRGPPLIQNTVSSQEFFRTLGNAPERLMQSLGDQYMLGTLTRQGGGDAFIVVSVESFEAALAAMLSWEEGSLSSVSALLRNSALPGKKLDWKDAVLKNTDARVLADERGELYLVYAFFDKKTLVIAGSGKTFTELLSRFGNPTQVLQ